MFDYRTFDFSEEHFVVLQIKDVILLPQSALYCVFASLLILSSSSSSSQSVVLSQLTDSTLRSC